MFVCAATFKNGKENTLDKRTIQKLKKLHTIKYVSNHKGDLVLEYRKLLNALLCFYVSIYRFKGPVYLCKYLLVHFKQTLKTIPRDD